MNAHDAGKNFIGAVFKAVAETPHIRTNSIPTEAPYSMIIVERYYVQTRRAYNIIQKGAPNIDKDMALQTAAKAVNGFVGTDGLVPILLVPGTLPRLGLTAHAPSPSKFQRARSVCSTAAEISKHFASRQVLNAPKSRNSLDVTNIHNTPIGAPVLVCFTENDLWEYLQLLLKVSAEDIALFTPQVAIKFRSTLMAPYLTFRDRKSVLLRATLVYTMAFSNETCNGLYSNIRKNHIFDHTFSHLYLFMT